MRKKNFESNKDCVIIEHLQLYFLLLAQSILSCHISNQKLKREHFVLKCTISIRDKKISTYILIDVAASRYGFISDFFSQTHDLPLIPLSTFISLKTFDRRPVVSGNITYKTIFDLSIEMNYKRMLLLITIVLRIPWLQKHDLPNKTFSKQLDFKLFILHQTLFILTGSLIFCS